MPRGQRSEMWTPEMRAKVGNAHRGRPGHKQTAESRAKIGEGSRRTRADERRPCKMGCGFASNHGAVAMHERNCGSFVCAIVDCDATKHKAHRLCHRHYGLMRHARKYGMTLDSYLALYEAQGRACAICRAPGALIGEPSPDRMATLAFDHCHTTGAFRALLCSRCNTGLGWFKEDPELLRAAALYLERYANA